MNVTEETLKELLIEMKNINVKFDKLIVLSNATLKKME